MARLAMYAAVHLLLVFPVLWVYAPSGFVRGTLRACRVVERTASTLTVQTMERERFTVQQYVRPHEEPLLDSPLLCEGHARVRFEPARVVLEHVFFGTVFYVGTVMTGSALLFIFS